MKVEKKKKITRTHGRDGRRETGQTENTVGRVRKRATIFLLRSTILAGVSPNLFTTEKKRTRTEAEKEILLLKRPLARTYEEVSKRAYF